MSEPVSFGTAAMNWAALALGQQRTIADLIAVFGAQQRTLDEVTRRLDERDAAVMQLQERIDRLEADRTPPMPADLRAGDDGARRR